MKFIYTFANMDTLKNCGPKSLNRNSLRILTSMDAPKAYQPGLNHDSPERDLALTKGQMLGLRKHFQEHFKDPRRENRTDFASSLLVFITMALFAGRDTLTSIQRYGNLLSNQQRRWLDFPRKERHDFAQSSQLDSPL